MKEHEIKVRCKRVGHNKYEVEGVIFYSTSESEAISKWCRTKKPMEVENEHT